MKMKNKGQAAMPTKTPEQIALEIQADKNRDEWNVKRDAAYCEKKAAKAKPAHWSANCHLSGLGRI